MNEMDQMQVGAEGIELPDVDLDQGGDVLGGEGGKKSNPAIFAIVLVLMLGAQAVGSHFLIKKMFFSKPPKPKVKTEKAENAPFGQVFPLTGIIVNPKDTRGSKHLLVDINFQISNEKVAAQLTELDPLIRDNIITFFSAQRYEVLTDITMRENIRRRVIEIVNYHLSEGQVENAFFVRYVLQ